MFNREWDESIPTKDTEARDIDVFIRHVEEAVRERLAVEHQFYADEEGEDDVGEHKTGSARLSFGDYDSRPDNNEDNPGAIYVAVDTGQLLYDTGTEWEVVPTMEILLLDDPEELPEPDSEIPGTLALVEEPEEPRRFLLDNGEEWLDIPITEEGDELVPRVESIEDDIEALELEEAPDNEHKTVREARTIGGYEIQVDGDDGEGIINFHTEE